MTLNQKLREKSLGNHPLESEKKLHLKIICFFPTNELQSECGWLGSLYLAWRVLAVKVCTGGVKKCSPSGDVGPLEKWLKGDE